VRLYRNRRDQRLPAPGIPPGIAHFGARRLQIGLRFGETFWKRAWERRHLCLLVL